MNSERRIVLTHWNPGVFNKMSTSRVLTELVVYALLYDEVLIREEDLITNEPIARFISRPENLRVFEELLSTGLIKFLRLPLKFYPTDRKYHPEKSPISARAEEQELRCSFKGEPWSPSERQTHLFKQLDDIVAAAPLQRSKEHADFPVGNPFASKLAELLEDRHKYRHPLLKLNDLTVKQFSSFCTDPEAWQRFLRNSGVKQVIVGRDPGFYRGAAYQCASVPSLLPDRHKILPLVESVYAATYCNREDADGRYGGSKLVELPYYYESDNEWDSGIQTIINVEVVPGNLPLAIATRPGIAEVLLRTRQTTAFANVRRALDQLGKSSQLDDLPTDEPFRDAWTDLSSQYADQCNRVWSSTSHLPDRVAQFLLWTYRLGRGALGFALLRHDHHLAGYFVTLDPRYILDELATYAIEQLGPLAMQALRSIGTTATLRDSMVATTRISSRTVRCSTVLLERRRRQKSASA